MSSNQRSSILEAIRQGDWDYEPGKPKDSDWSSTSAIPGSDEKIEVLSARINAGLPLWHPEDRRSYSEDLS